MRTYGRYRMLEAIAIRGVEIEDGNATLTEDAFGYGAAVLLFG